MDIILIHCEYLKINISRNITGMCIKYNVSTCPVYVSQSPPSHQDNLYKFTHKLVSKTSHIYLAIKIHQLPSLRAQLILYQEPLSHSEWNPIRYYGLYKIMLHILFRVDYISHHHLWHALTGSLMYNNRHNGL